MYYIYHIPGKKIGVTRDLNNRVTKQQGYASDEYEVLLATEDIGYVSAMEIELQKSYGYKVDRQSYRNLIKPNIMKINVTEQTTTFPCPLNKLKGNLMDNLGFEWETNHGSFTLNNATIDWIVSNANVSMFNNERCFVYNKALANVFISKEEGNEIGGLIQEIEKLIKKQQPVEPPRNTVYDNIRAWAKTRGIYAKGDSKTQYVKLMEETGELAKALLNDDKPEIIDAIGDIVVVLTNLAHLESLKIEDCIESAYDVIKNRKGKMENGTFVKETL